MPKTKKNVPNQVFFASVVKNVKELDLIFLFCQRLFHCMRLDATQFSTSHCTKYFSVFQVKNLLSAHVSRIFKCFLSISSLCFVAKVIILRNVFKNSNTLRTYSGCSIPYLTVDICVNAA